MSAVEAARSQTVMKLKKLDIIGFKSFFEKASIAFPPGICAVVGPNGFTVD
jgi:chromosome segregation protein